MGSGRRFADMILRASTSSADARSSRADKSDAAPQHLRMPQAPPMERSGAYQQQSPSDSEDTISTSSPSDERQSSYTAATSPECSPDETSCRKEEAEPDLHDPLRCDSTMLRLAEMLCESIVDDKPWCFSLWTEIESDYLLSYDYNEHEATVIAVYQLLKKASLPIDTYILGALILKELAAPSRHTGDFYNRWYKHVMSPRLLKFNRRRYEAPGEAPAKEVIILAALIIAQKFLHDSIYTMTTWTDIVCDERDDIHNSVLYTTERLILDHIQWDVWTIATPSTVEAWVTKAENEKLHAVSRFSKLLYFPSEHDYYEGVEGEEGEAHSPIGY